jgi:hypothetical protein
VACNDGFDGLIGVRLGVDQSTVEIKEQGTHASAISHLTYSGRARLVVVRSQSTIACCDVR